MRRSWQDPLIRRNVGLLFLGKAIGLILVLTAMKVYLAPVIYAQAARPRPRTRCLGQRDQHGLDADRGVPRLRHAGRLRHARGRLRPLARVGQHPGRRHRRHLHLRRPLLGLGLRLHVRGTATASSARTASSCRACPTPTARPASRCWPSGSSSSPSPTPARRSPRAPWSAAAASSATSSTASASPASSIPIIGHWAWGPDGWLAAMHRARSTTSPARPSSTPSAAPSRWPARSRSARGSAACSSVTAAADAAAQHHHRRRRRPDPLVRLVRLQPRQHAVGAGRRRASAASSFNTTMAACSAGLAALFYARTSAVEKWDLGLTINGFLAGLVAITCPCYWVSPIGAFFIGIVAGVRGRLGDSTCSNTCASTIRSARSRCTWSPASGARSRSASSRRASTALPTPTGADTSVGRHRPVLRRRRQPADGAGHRQRRPSPSPPSSSRWS